MAEFTHGQDTFDRLLDAMPSIVEVVNRFESKHNQKAALDALIRAIGVPGESPSVPVVPQVGGEAVLHAVPSGPAEPVESPASADERETDNGDKASRRRKGRSTSKKSYQVPKNLNFAPDGQPSLEEFVSEKQPRTNDERSLVACYYLTEMMDIEHVGVEEVLAVYLAADWDPPAHPGTSLRGTASRTGWIDTSNSESIKVVWKGETYLKGKMPSEKKTAI